MPEVRVCRKFEKEKKHEEQQTGLPVSVPGLLGSGSTVCLAAFIPDYL